MPWVFEGKLRYQRHGTRCAPLFDVMQWFLVQVLGTLQDFACDLSTAPHRFGKLHF